MLVIVTKTMLFNAGFECFRISMATVLFQSDFSHCIFHLYDFGEIGEGRIAEQILQANQGDQGWTFFSYQAPNVTHGFKLGSDFQVASSNRLFCNLNIFIEAGSRPAEEHPILVKAMKVHRKSIFLFHKIKTVKKLSLPPKIDASENYLFLLSNSSVLYVCVIPSIRGQCNFHNFNVKKRLEFKLLEMMWASKHVDLSTAIVGVFDENDTHLGESVRETNDKCLEYLREGIFQIQCSHNTIIITILSENLNFTPKYYPSDWTKHSKRARMELRTATLTVIFRQLNLYISAAHGLRSFFMTNNVDLDLMYCKREEAYDKASIWLKPFTAETWIMLLMTVLLLCMLYLDQWFRAICIVLLQEDTNGTPRLMILLSFVMVILAAHYDGQTSVEIIHSRFKTATDLFQGGYRLYGHTWLDVTERSPSYAIVGSMLNLEMFVRFVPFGSFPFWRIFTTYNNSAIAVRKESVAFRMSYMKQHFPHLFCHVVSDTNIDTFKGKDSWVFERYLHHKMIPLLEWLQEAGIITMFQNNSQYVTDLPYLRYLETMSFYETRPKNLKLTTGRVPSIFQMWAVLLGIAALVFALEMCCTVLVELYNDIMYVVSFSAF